MSSHVAVITGAGRGIGAETAVLLASEGARVVLAARTERELFDVAARISSSGGEALPVRADVTREADVQRLFGEARERFGPVSLLVNNAGGVVPKPVATMSLEEWRATIDSNLASTFLCARAALADMIPAKRGRIVNVASVSGVANVSKFPGFVAYASAKAGVIAFTEALAAEVAPHGVSVLAVSPGSVATRLLEQVAPGLLAEMKPIDIARTIAFLASDAASVATGSNLVVRGPKP